MVMAAASPPQKGNAAIWITAQARYTVISNWSGETIDCLKNSAFVVVPKH